MINRCGRAHSGDRAGSDKRESQASRLQPNLEQLKEQILLKIPRKKKQKFYLNSAYVLS